MQHTPPDWTDWPARSPPSSANGHDLHLGSALGQLLAATHQQTRTLERISDRIEDLPDRLARASAARSPPPPPSPAPSPPAPIPPGLLAALTVRDIIMLATALGMLVLVLMGKATLREVLDATLGMTSQPPGKT